MALRGKMQGYAEARAAGMEPKDAAAHAGYEMGGIAVTVSRMERRADVQAEIKRLKRDGVGSETDNGPSSEADGRAKWGMKKRYASPLDLMFDVMNNPDAPNGVRYQAAKDALPYCHARKEGGKKDEAKDRAKKASEGKFQTAARPSHLRAVK